MTRPTRKQSLEISMWLAIVRFFSGPVIRGLLDAYNSHLKATTTDKQTASDLAGKEIAAQTLETQARTNLKIAEIGHPWEPEKLAFYVTLFYYAKILIWDKCFGLGTTDSLAGYAAVWAGMIMGFYFTQRTFQNVATILRR